VIFVVGVNLILSAYRGMEIVDLENLPTAVKCCPNMACQFVPVDLGSALRGCSGRWVSLFAAQRLGSAQTLDEGEQR
jgi:hypothetical protein